MEVALDCNIEVSTDLAFREIERLEQTLPTWKQWVIRVLPRVHL